jgi:uncharacterized membrane protein
MVKQRRTVFRHSRQLGVIASLVFATLVCLGFVGLRMAHAPSVRYGGLLWNLCLAWLPACSALIAYNLYGRRSWRSWLLVPGCAFVWLMFLPNAPYLVTDIMHLKPQMDVPYWYDLLLVVAFAWTGVFLGVVSLFLMQEIVRQALGTLASWVFVFGVLGLSSFGVYVGKFLRWNSWDVFLSPMRLGTEVIAHVQQHPFAYIRPLEFSVLFAGFFTAVYVMVVAMTRWRPEGPEG